MADIAEKPDFEELCIKCEQMELDVSTVEIYFFKIVKFPQILLIFPFFVSFGPQLLAFCARPIYQTCEVADNDLNFLPILC